MKLSSQFSLPKQDFPPDNTHHAGIITAQTVKHSKGELSLLPTTELAHHRAVMGIYVMRHSPIYDQVVELINNAPDIDENSLSPFKFTAPKTIEDIVGSSYCSEGMPVIPTPHGDFNPITGKYV